MTAQDMPDPKDDQPTDDDLTTGPDADQSGAGYGNNAEEDLGGEGAGTDGNTADAGTSEQ